MSFSYKSSGVIGGPIDSGVKKQLDARTAILVNERNRTDQELLYLNSATGWVKFSSSVNVDGSSTFAENNILTGGTATATVIKGGIFNPENNAYDLSAINGYKPMPGITSFNVKSKNTFGTLREAVIQFKVHSIEQLDIMESLYLRPGMGALVEWGHSIYCDSNIIKPNIDTTVETYQGFFTPKSEISISNDLVKLKTDSFYNYDALYGFIKNFSWSYNLDGGYDCRVDVISKGELIESLQILISPTATAETTLTTTSTTNTGGQSNAGAGQSSFEDEYFSSIQNPSATTTTTGGQNQGSNEQALVNTNNVQKINTTNLHILLHVLKTTPTGANAPITNAVKKTMPTIFEKINTNLNSVQRPFPNSMLFLGIQSTISNNGKYPEMEKLRHIKMSTFLEIVNRVFTLKTKYGNNVVEFYYGQGAHTTPYYTFPGHFALDPTIAIIPKQETSGFKYKVQAQAKSAPSTEDDILNIYLCTDFILSCYDAVVEQEDVDEKTLVKFIKRILKGLTETFGYVNDFDLHYEEDTFRYYVVDRRVTPGNSNLQSADINLIGLNSQVENLSLTSTLSNNITTMLAISATAGGSDIGTDMLMLQQWNNGLRNRHLSRLKISEPSGAATEGEEELTSEQKDMLRLSKFLDEVNATAETYYLKYDPADIEGLIPAHKFLMNTLSERKSKVSKQSPGGIIPFKLSFNIRGVSGLKIGQAFKLSEETELILPEKYRGRVAFIITGLNHSVSNNRWTVQVDSQMILSATFAGTATDIDLGKSSAAEGAARVLGWTTEIPKKLEALTDQEAVEFVNGATDNCSLKTMMLAIMIQEQGGVDNKFISGPNFNFFGIDITGGWQRTSIPEANGFVIAGEGGTYKQKPFASFESKEQAQKAAVRIMSQPKREFTTVTNAKEAGIAWLKNWNGNGIQDKWKASADLQRQYPSLDDYYDFASREFQNHYNKAKELVKC